MKSIISRLTIIIVSVFLIQHSTVAQHEIPVTENVLKANFILPGISFETPMAKRQTLYAEAYLSPYFYYTYSSNFGNSSDFGVIPALNLHHRYYYNGAKRRDNGVSTALNSMNYLALHYQPSISNGAIADRYINEYNDRLVNLVGIVWGFQRNYRNRISIDMYVGPGCMFATSTTINNMGQLRSRLGFAPSIIISARFGLWLNKRKEKPSALNLSDLHPGRAARQPRQV